MSRSIRVLCAVLWLLGGARAVGGADLEEMVKGADVIVHGEVIKTTEGEMDAESLRIGVKLRTDVAVVAVQEVLKGDPTLRKVEVGFPAFPRAGELKLELKQQGVWLLTKSDRKYYVLKTGERFLPDQPESKLGMVRRALRAAAGLTEPPVRPEERAARVARLCQELDAKQPEGTRRLAAFQLGELGELRAVPALIDALSDEVPSVRLAADIALRRVTGHQAQVDFQSGPQSLRARGVEAWRQWWAGNKERERKEILGEAARASARPQPGFQYAVEGLAQYDDPELLALFLQVLDLALASKNEELVIASARYLGRTRSRGCVPKLVGVVEDPMRWSASVRAAAAAAVAKIAGTDFGTGDEVLGKCIEWWRENKDKFR